MIKQKICDLKNALIIDENQRRYCTGYKSTDGYLLILKEIYFFVDKRYLYSAKKELQQEGVKVREFTGFEEIRALLAEQGVRKLSVDFSKTTVTEMRRLKALGVTFKDMSARLEKMFSIKDRKEIDTIKGACKIAEKAFYDTIKEIVKGVTEKQVANYIDYLMKSYGAEGASFETIVAFGENSAVPHHQSGDKVLEDNMPILMDFGCKYNGYCSDCTRTVFFGEPTEKFKRTYTQVYKANYIAQEKIEPGMSFKEGDELAREYLKSEGVGENFTHSLGHGIGVNIHEYPNLSPKQEDGTFRNGMVFSIEPGVYFEGEFGIRLEDTCALIDGRVRKLFNDTKDLIIL